LTARRSISKLDPTTASATSFVRDISMEEGVQMASVVT